MKKKAQVTGVALFVSMVVILSLVLIFLVLANIKDAARERDISRKIGYIDKDLLLFTLLRTPVDKDHNFADFINLYLETNDKKYLRGLEKIANNSLDPFYREEVFWRLEVNDKKLFKQKPECEEDIRFVKQIILSFDGKNTVKLYDCEEGFI